MKNKTFYTTVNEPCIQTDLPGKLKASAAHRLARRACVRISPTFERTNDALCARGSVTNRA